MTEEAELTSRCHALADAHNGSFVMRPLPASGHEAMIVVPKDVDPDSLDATFPVGRYCDNTRWGAMRRLLNEPGARAEGRR